VRSAIVAGSVAQRPGRGGHTWVFLQYLLGLRDLGWDVLLLDRLEPDMSADAEGTENVRYLEDVLSRFDLAGDYCLMLDGGTRTRGVERGELLDRVEASELFLNVNGFVTDDEVLQRARLRVFLDIDPGFGQMWRALGLHDLFAGHDRFVTVGESVGRPGCKVPTCGLDWITTAQPVVLAHWPDQPHDGRGAFTSVGSWRGPFGPIEFEGETYGLRVHEFRRFAELPRQVDGERFEVALDIDDADGGDVKLLRANDWELVDPRVAARDPWAYRDYVQASKAELMVAKNMYVRSRSGWFSDRSICYLASGRPVLAQETGFSDHHPVGEGLLAFSTPEEAAAGAAAIARDYERHAQAARALAEDQFDSRVVLGRLLERLEIA
jgi:hypothetical protein